MTLIINNHDVEKLLTMEMTIDALEQAYKQLVTREAVCRPRIDIQIPTSDPNKIYQWGTMEGGSTSGYFAIRMKSDVVYETRYNGAITQEKYCTKPGLFCGLIFLTSVETGEPLAFVNDGVLQGELMHGWYRAAWEHGVLNRRKLDRWLLRRLEAVRAERSRLTVGHFDIWAYPPALEPRSRSNSRS